MEKAVINNNNINCNDNNIFVNFSSLLLIGIVKLLDDALDKICFTLTCKKWFNNRNTLIQTVEIIDKHSVELSNHCFLNSYRDVFQRSLSLDISMCIGTRDTYPDKYFHSFDFFGKLEMGGNIKEELLKIDIPQDVTKLRIGTRYLSMDVYKQIIERCPNINSIELTKFFYAEIQPGTIPKQIKSLSNYNNASHSFPTPLSKEIFHEGLESLELSLYDRYNTDDIEPSVFPSTLKKLTYRGHSFMIEQLPAQLEELYLMDIHDSRLIEIDSFPTSLTTIRITSGWVSQLKGLPFLKKIIFGDEIEEHFFKSFYKGDIPSVVTHIDFGSNSYFVLEGLIPPTVKNLNMGYTEYYLGGEDGISKFFTEAHQFDYLNLGTGLVLRQQIIQPGDIPSVRHLVIYNDQDYHSKLLQLETGCIPSGVEILEIGLPTEYQMNLIPNTIHELTYTLSKVNYNRKLDRDEIPSSVRTLKFNRYRNEVIPEQSIPPSVTKVCFSNIYGEMNNSWKSIQLPSTVTSINVLSNSGDKYFLRKISDDDFILIKYTSKDHILRSGFIRFSDIDNFSNLELGIK